MPISILHPTAAMQRAFRHPRYAIYSSETLTDTLELHSVLLGTDSKGVRAFLDGLLESGRYKVVKFRKFPAIGEIPKTLKR
jgi:hypothetical protein